MSRTRSSLKLTLQLGQFAFDFKEIRLLGGAEPGVFGLKGRQWSGYVWDHDRLLWWVGHDGAVGPLTQMGWPTVEICSPGLIEIEGLGPVDSLSVGRDGNFSWPVVKSSKSRSRLAVLTARGWNTDAGLFDELRLTTRPLPEWSGPEERARPSALAG